MSLANRFTLPLAVLSLALLAGCGSSNNVNPNNNGFSNSDFSGTYVFSFSGTDVSFSNATTSFFAIAGTITADGKGNITGGTVDINDGDLGGVFPAQALSASTYSVGSDGRGTGSLVTPEGTFNVDFVLISDSGGLISRFDDSNAEAGSGSGTFSLQGSATQGQLTNMAFTMFGSDPGFNNVGTVGGFSLNGSGTITSGVEDFNDNTVGIANQVLTGSVVLNSSTTGTATLNTSFAPGLTFDVWVVDSTHLKLIETDSTSGLAMAGDAFQQQSTFTSGQLVFSMAGGDSNSAVVAGGFATTDANGNLTNGTEDFNDTGNTETITGFSASCNATAPFPNDRCQLVTSLFSNGAVTNVSFAAYPTTAGVLLLEDDNLGYLQGAAYAQSATAFSAPANYALNLTGFNLISNGGWPPEVDDIAQFNATSTGVTGVLDENDVGSALITAKLTGSYTPDPQADGRGSMGVTANGTFNGVLGLEYYVIDSSTAVFIEGDLDQWTFGLFAAQSTPSGSVAQSAKSRAHASAVPSLISLVHPLGKSHTTFKHPKN